MKLLASDASPYGRKVRIVLIEKKIPYEYLMVRSTSAEVAAANPLLQVPTLVRDDGRALYDSAVIVEYLDVIGPAARLIPQDFEDRIEVLRWQALGDGVLDSTVAVSHDLRLAEGERKPEAWYARHQKKIDNGLAVMERDLGDGAFCHGARLSLADVCCGTALGYLDHVWSRQDWRKDHPNLARHAGKLAGRDSVPFAITLPAPA